MMRPALTKNPRKLLLKTTLFGISLAGLFFQTASARSQTQQNCGDTTVLVTGQVTEESFGDYKPSLAGATIQWDITQSEPGVLKFSLSADGPFTDTLRAPMTYDGSGNGTCRYYVKGASQGHSIIYESSPQCGGGAPQCGGTIPPADYTVKGCSCPTINPNL